MKTLTPLTSKPRSKICSRTRDVLPGLSTARPLTLVSYNPATLIELASIIDGTFDGKFLEANDMCAGDPVRGSDET